MQEYTIEIKRTLIQMGIFAAILSVGAVSANKAQLIPGFLFGTLGSGLYFLQMCYRVKKSADMPPDKAVGYMRSGWIVRLSFIVVFLVLALEIGRINFLAAVVGLFALHIVIVFNAFVIVAKSFLK